MIEHATRARTSGFLECGTDEQQHVVFPPLLCPAGHRIPWEFAFHEAGYPRCTQRDGRGNHEICNARLFLQFFPRLNKSANPMLFVAEITHEEIKHITRASMDVPEIMTYLGITWAPLPAVKAVANTSEKL